MTKKEISAELNTIVNKLSELHSEFGINHLDISDDCLTTAHNSIYTAFVMAMKARNDVDKI